MDLPYTSFHAGRFVFGGVAGVSPARKGRPQRSAGVGEDFPLPNALLREWRSVRKFLDEGFHGFFFFFGKFFKVLYERPLPE